MRSVCRLIVAILSVAALLVACSSPAPATPPSASPSVTTVNIDAGDYFIHPSQTEFKVGVKYHFVVHNSGEVAHEVMLMPVMADSSGMDMEEMDKMAMGMVEEEDFPPGATQSFDVTFDKPYADGQLEFACHITNHYEKGMHEGITVEQ
jgi:uncharacterized cupredoxin-like copper-binding protein